MRVPPTQLQSGRLRGTRVVAIRGKPKQSAHSFIYQNIRISKCKPGRKKNESIRIETKGYQRETCFSMSDSTLHCVPHCESQPSGEVTSWLLYRYNCHHHKASLQISYKLYQIRLAVQQHTASNGQMGMCFSNDSPVRYCELTVNYVRNKCAKEVC